MLHTNQPFSLVIFGASGHLAKIKLYPALYVLALKKRLPEQYNILGYARTKMTDQEFRAHIDAAVRADMLEVNEKVLKEFLSHCTYIAGAYDQIDDFQKLATKLTTLDQAGTAVRLAYLSIPPTMYEPTLMNICRSGVHAKGIPFRCIIEKPVGLNLKTFEQVYEKLTKCFALEEIYILDHYLGKEAARNVYYLRHANPVIERLLKNTLIRSVQISASESAGLEGRAGYFDAVGTLRDMFQSHLLEIAALLAMHIVSDAKDMKAARTDAMQKFYLPHASDLSEVVMQGQYAAGKINRASVPAYAKEDGVRSGSRTATFAALRLLSRSSRWEGVPFFLRSGKRLKDKETRITIEFQDSPSLLGKQTARNRLDIILQGEAGMRLYLQTKLGGTDPNFRPLVLTDPLVCVGDCLPEHSQLILEAIEGNQQWFLDPEEVRASWRLIDPLQKYLDDPKTPLSTYASGSAGPEEAEKFIERFGERWM